MWDPFRVAVEPRTPGTDEIIAGRFCVAPAYLLLLLHFLFFLFSSLSFFSCILFLIIIFQWLLSPLSKSFTL